MSPSQATQGQVGEGQQSCRDCYSSSQGCDVVPWGQSGSILLPCCSLATLVNGASSSLPGSCPGRGWGLHPSPHDCTPLPGVDTPFIPTLCAPPCSAIRGAIIHHPQWHPPPPPHPARGVARAIPGDPQGRVSLRASVNRTKLLGCRASGGARSSRGRFPRRRAGGRLWGGHPPFVGYCWPSVTCRGRGVTQAGMTRPANRTRGGCAGAGMRKVMVAPGCCRDP